MNRAETNPLNQPTLDNGLQKQKESEVKFIKKVSPNKAKLPSRRDGGIKTELIKSTGIGCVPQGQD